MAYEAPPARTGLNDTYPNPSNAVFKAAIGDLWDFVTGLLGLSGNPEGAFDALKLIDSNGIWNLRPTFAVATNALTVTIKGNDNADLSTQNPGYVHQRATALNDSVINRRKVSANFATTISSGSTAGHSSTHEGLIYWYYIENGSGGIELAWTSTYRGMMGRFSTTAEGGAGGADSATTMYSTTARTDVPGRLAFITRDTQTVAGTWTAIPTEVIYPPFNAELHIGQSPNSFQTLTDAANIVWNTNKGRKAVVTLAGDRILDNPIGLVDGERYMLVFIQDGTGTRDITWGSAYHFPGGIDPVMTQTPAAVDVLEGIARNGVLYCSFGADMK
jgi:hypothetical protein